jgi:hypothetical protein
VHAWADRSNYAGTLACTRYRRLQRSGCIVGRLQTKGSQAARWLEADGHTAPRFWSSLRYIHLRRLLRDVELNPKPAYSCMIFNLSCFRLESLFHPSSACVVPLVTNRTLFARLELCNRARNRSSSDINQLGSSSAHSSRGHCDASFLVTQYVRSVALPSCS